MRKVMIVVAGGSGSRMKSTLPKQFIKLKGKPILMHTIERLVEFDQTMDIVLVLPENQIDFWKELCLDYDFNINCEIAIGGANRFESVKSGLNKVHYECLVGVHDGVRPLVSDETLNNCFIRAEKYGSAVPVTDAIESIRVVDEDNSYSVEREYYKMVQTPQVFLYSKLIKAYDQSFNASFTDDASVYEKAGFEIHLAKGNRENIKVTTPMDLIIAEALMKVE